MLTPRSSKALCHLGEVLYILSEHSPTSVNLGDIEKCFRSSLAMEGKNIHNEDLPNDLIECDFWKEHIKQKENSKSSVKEESVVATKSPAKATPNVTKGTGRG